MTEKNVRPIIEYYESHTQKQTLSVFDITVPSLKRYIRYWKNTLNKKIDRKKLYLDRIANKMSSDELKNLSDNFGLADRDDVPIEVDNEGENIKFGVVSDPHIGSVYTNYNYVRSVVEYLNNQPLDFVIMVGDLTDGLTRRGDHIYKLTELGFDPQKDRFVELFRSLKHKIYAVIGNHDRWYIRKNNSNIGLAIQKELGKDKFEYVGNPNTSSGTVDDIGYLMINGLGIQLVHYGSATYNISYAMQKYIRALEPDEIPDVLLMGHTHKSFFMKHKGCFCINSGCLQDQTSFMHSKSLESHTGFWIVDMVTKNGKIKSIVPEWYEKEEE